tara:strand:+ start:287 stop:1819 length:1533 start_codon:yes stop_codon:yes gene_type:complete
MIKKLFTPKFFIVFIFLTLLMKPVWLFDIQNLGFDGDDLSYWLHATSIAIDYDLLYLDDHNLGSDIFHENTNAPSHPPGAGYFSAPFVYAFNILDKITGNDLDRINPIGSYSYLGYFFATQFYTLIGFYFLSKLFSINRTEKFQYSILFLAYLSTLVHYSATRFLMSHAIEFCFVSMLFYFFEKNTELTLKQLNYCIFIYFCLSITRPSTFLISLCFVLMYRAKIIPYIKNFRPFFLLAILVTIYIFISQTLYESNNILLSLSENKTTESFVDSISFQTLLQGFFKLPQLFFSTSGGLIWTTPIIFFGTICYFINQFNNKNFNFEFFVFSSLFLIGFFIIAMVWQGREVAYGQRLFIGLIPFAAYQVSLCVKKNSSHRFVIFLIITGYIHYLFLYSSDLLTLREGYSLWGTFIKYSAENYTLNLLNELLNIENYLAVIVKSLYSINFFGIVEFDSFMNFIPSSLENIEKIQILESRANKYFDFNYGYILMSSLIYLGFSFLFLKTISNKK